MIKYKGAIHNQDRDTGFYHSPHWKFILQDEISMQMPTLSLFKGDFTIYRLS